MKLSELRKRYLLGENISKLLAGDNGLNSESNIEIAYELQAGSYSKLALENSSFLIHIPKRNQIL